MEWKLKLILQVWKYKAKDYKLHITWGFLLCGLLFFATSFEIYSASQFYLSLVTGLDVTQNISTAESPDTLYATNWQST